MQPDIEFWRRFGQEIAEKREDEVSKITAGSPSWEVYQRSVGYLRALGDAEELGRQIFKEMTAPLKPRETKDAERQ